MTYFGVFYAYQQKRNAPAWMSTTKGSLSEYCSPQRTLIYFLFFLSEEGKKPQALLRQLYNSIRQYICFEWPCYGFSVSVFSFLPSLPCGMRSLFLRGQQKRKYIFPLRTLRLDRSLPCWMFTPLNPILLLFNRGLCFSIQLWRAVKKYSHLYAQHSYDQSVPLLETTGQ